MELPEYLQEQQRLYALSERVSVEAPALRLKIDMSGRAYAPNQLSLFNMRPWWEEIVNCAQEITYSLTNSRAYDLLSHELGPTPRSYEIQLFERNYYLTVAILKLFSFRDKVAHLIYNLFDQRLPVSKTPTGRPKVSYYTTNNALKTFQGQISWISDADMEDVMHILARYGTPRADELSEFRHASVHRSAPGVGHVGKGMSFLRSETEEGKVIYIIGHEEKQWSYDELIRLAVQVLEEFIEATQQVASLKWFDYVLRY